MYIFFPIVKYQFSEFLRFQESKASVGLRNICYLVKKAEKKWWSRLQKQEGRPPVFLKVDWDKWVDEDEEQEDTKRECNVYLLTIYMRLEYIVIAKFSWLYDW